MYVGETEKPSKCSSGRREEGTGIEKGPTARKSSQVWPDKTPEPQYMTTECGKEKIGTASQTKTPTGRRREGPVLVEQGERRGALVMPRERNRCGKTGERLNESAGKNREAAADGESFFGPLQDRVTDYETDKGTTSRKDSVKCDPDQRTLTTRNLGWRGGSGRGITFRCGQRKKNN